MANQHINDTESLLIDFYNGCHLLQDIAGWPNTSADKGIDLERLDLFSHAYEELSKLHAKGQFSAGSADFSRENLDRIKRIQVLARVIQGSEPAHAHEIAALARLCLEGLLRK